MPTDYFVLGAGGHAKTVLDTLQKNNKLARLFDANPAVAGNRLLGTLIEPQPHNNALPPYGHLAIGNNETRRRLFDTLSPYIKKWFNIIHPQSTIASSAKIELGCFIAAQAIIGCDTTIGYGCIVNHGAVIDHDCNISNYCHIAPNATLGGGVVLSEGVLVGSGATLLPGVHVGYNAVVGSGAVVTSNIPDNVTVIGVPARKK